MIEDDDNDNEDILEDIIALEKVLAQEDNEININKKLSKYNSTELANNDLEYSKDEFSYSLSRSLAVQTSKEDIVNLTYESNERLINSINTAIKAITERLNDCMKRQQEVDFQIQLISKGGKANWKIQYVKAGMPYFKDKKYFPSPANEETKTKRKNNELTIFDLQRPTKWTKKDRNLLKIGVRGQAANDAFNRMIKTTGNSNDGTEDSTECIPPKDLLSMVGPLGSREFDWMKISIVDLKGRHSPNECRVIWNILLHPEINDGKWTVDEDSTLKILARQHKYQDWDKIAEELKTNRTAYVCFIRYTTLYSSIYTDAAWTASENDVLSTCIELLKFGDFIPWGRISTYINNRTKNQIYTRWRYHLDPSVRKGRFTPEEDELILDSVSKFGKNFPKIAAEIMPDRTSVQISGRFRLLMLKTNSSYNSWTVSEDRTLLQLYEEFGTQWSLIANIMKKDRTYLRHRYAVVKRHVSKGNSLASLPRKRPRDGSINSDNANSDDDDDDYIYNCNYNININTKRFRTNESEELNIDAQLIEYFQSIHARKVQPGRKKTHYTTDQLEINTQKLYHIFEMLDVNINIPDNLNDYNLTEKEKELLVSLKQYYSEKSTLELEKIEQYRQKMFGDINLHDNEEPYIPPAPFGLFQGQRRVKKNSSGKIDASNMNNSQQYEISFVDIHTPFNILKVLKHDEINHFKCLNNLAGKKCKNWQFPGRLEQACVQTIEDANDFHTKKLQSLNKPLKKILYSAQDSNSDTLSKAQSKKDISIKPNYSTLLGYQNLLIMKSTLPNSNEINEDVARLNTVKLTASTKNSFHLLETRLFCLFKYPIVMARITPNKKVEKSNKNSCNNGKNSVNENLEDCLNDEELGNNELLSDCSDKTLTVNNGEIQDPEITYEIKCDTTDDLDLQNSYNNPALTGENQIPYRKYIVIPVHANNSKPKKS